MKCDANAFARMYETVYRDLYRFALCMMKNPHDAEDAVSDAVLKAYEKISSLRSEEAFKSWMFTILANTCKRRLKQMAEQKNRETASFFTVAGEERAGGTEDSHCLSMDVQKAFAVLSEEEQMIVGLSVFGGYQSKEIGSMTGLNHNTVRSKRARALEKMGIVLAI